MSEQHYTLSQISAADVDTRAARLGELSPEAFARILGAVVGVSGDYSDGFVRCVVFDRLQALASEDATREAILRTLNEHEEKRQRTRQGWMHDDYRRVRAENYRLREALGLPNPDDRDDFDDVDPIDLTTQRPQEIETIADMLWALLRGKCIEVRDGNAAEDRPDERDR